MYCFNIALYINRWRFGLEVWGLSPRDFLKTWGAYRCVFLASMNKIDDFLPRPKQGGGGAPLGSAPDLCILTSECTFNALNRPYSMLWIGHVSMLWIGHVFHFPLSNLLIVFLFLQKAGPLRLTKGIFLPLFSLLVWNITAIIYIIWMDNC